MTQKSCVCCRRITRQVLEIEKGICKLCGGDLLLNPSNSQLANITEKAKLSDTELENEDNAQHIYQVPSDISKCPTPFSRTGNFPSDFLDSGKIRRNLPIVTHAMVHTVPKCPDLDAIGTRGSGSLRNSFDDGVNDVLNNMSIPSPVLQKLDDDVFSTKSDSLHLMD